MNLLFLVDLLHWVELHILQVLEDVNLVVKTLEFLLLDVTLDLSGFELIVEDGLDEFQWSLIQFLLFLKNFKKSGTAADTPESGVTEAQEELELESQTLQLALLGLLFPFLHGSLNAFILHF